MIHLLDIDPGNWRLDLAVSEAQKSFVSDRAKLLARAYAYRAQRSRAFLISPSAWDSITTSRSCKATI